MSLPANEFIGLYGKIGLWKHGNLKLTKLTMLNVDLREFCEFHSTSIVRMWREHDERWQDTSPVVLRWMDCWVGLFCFLWWECLCGSVQGFGNESAVLDEGVVAERL